MDEYKMKEATYPRPHNLSHKTMVSVVLEECLKKTPSAHQHGLIMALKLLPKFSSSPTKLFLLNGVGSVR